MENRIRKFPMFPSRKYDVSTDDNKKSYKFLMYTENDANKFEVITNKADEKEFFNNISKFFKEKQEILKIEDLEFRYTNLDYIDMESAFILTDETSTWDKDYNS